MIAALLCVAACVLVDPPTPESISIAPPEDRPLLIEAMLRADRKAVREAQTEDDRADAALTLAHDLLTLAWARTLAPERALLGVATAQELQETSDLAASLFDAVEPWTGPGSKRRELLPYRAAAVTLQAAVGEASPMDAQASWQGIDVRRQRARLLRLAIWAADASGNFRSSSDRLSLLLKRGVLAETWLAQLNKRLMHGEGRWPSPDEAWQILLLAEARAHATTELLVQEALLADALPRLVAAGWQDDEAAAVLTDRMAALPVSQSSQQPGTALARTAHAAAQVTRGDLDAWREASMGLVSAPWARTAAHRAARGYEAQGRVLDAMAALAGAALAGDRAAAQYVAAWLLGLGPADPDGGVINMLKAHPDSAVSRVAAGVGSLRAGRRESAIRDWVSVPPGTRLQAGALAAAAAQLGHVDLDVLGTSLRRLRTAAVMAATDAEDPERARLARRASGWALAAAIDHALSHDRMEEADRLLTLDPGVKHLEQIDRLRLQARLDLRRGQADAAIAALAAHDAAIARQLLIERAQAVIGSTRGLDPIPGAIDPRGLRRILGLLERHLDAGDSQQRLLLADALRLGGRGETDRYRQLLEDHPHLGDAMLGLAELLIQDGSEAQRAEAMSLYRGLTNAPRETDPDRWWLAQLRMLELASTAGRPNEELDARLARLRHDATDLGGAKWSRAITQVVQSGN